MTRNEKKAVIESMAEKFMNIDDLEGKSMTIMVMSAYAEGKAAGKAQGCVRRWRKYLTHTIIAFVIAGDCLTWLSLTF